MKRSVALLLVINTLITACKKNDVLNGQQVDLNSSYQKFVAFKSANLDSYTYTASTHSFAGSSTKTTITVVNGKVVGRSCNLYDSLPNGQQGPVLVSWVEDQTNIGSHTQGSEALTLDQIYDKAKNVWLKVDSSANSIYFKTDANGLIMSCGYSAKNCADDCFVGINIISIAGAKI